MSNQHTILGQMLQMFSRFEFQKAVSEHKTEYHSRGFRSWNHFVAMLFGQLSGQDSLRNIEAGMATQAKSLYHLGIKPIHRSTLSYANKHRSHELFKKIFDLMLSKCLPVSPKHKFKFKNPLFSLDATSIDLCLSLYNWAKFRTTKGAVKLHVKLNHSGYLPTFAILTNAKDADQKTAPLFPFEKNDVVVFDRGYTSFKWFKTLNNKGVYFVTRLKKDVQFKILKQKNVTNMKNILYDQTIAPTGFCSQQYSSKLRRIQSIDPRTNKTIVILTNNFEWSAETVSAVYKERWQIELFFKTIKQQLKVKSFVGTSKNALLSQLWTALIAYLLLSYLKFKSRFAWSIYTLCSILPTNLFARRNLLDWLNAPFHEKSNKPPGSKLQLGFNF